MKPRHVIVISVGLFMSGMSVGRMLSRHEVQEMRTQLTDTLRASNELEQSDAELKRADAALKEADIRLKAEGERLVENANYLLRSRGCPKEFKVVISQLREQGPHSL